MVRIDGLDDVRRPLAAALVRRPCSRPACRACAAILVDAENSAEIDRRAMDRLATGRRWRPPASSALSRLGAPHADQPITGAGGSRPIGLSRQHRQVLDVAVDENDVSVGLKRRDVDRRRSTTRMSAHPYRRRASVQRRHQRVERRRRSRRPRCARPPLKFWSSRGSIMTPASAKARRRLRTSPNCAPDRGRAATGAFASLIRSNLAFRLRPSDPRRQVGVERLLVDPDLALRRLETAGGRLRSCTARGSSVPAAAALRASSRTAIIGRLRVRGRALDRRESAPRRRSRKRRLAGLWIEQK